MKPIVDAGRPPQHSGAFKARRFLNWFPLGLSYAFLYMGRYNLTVAKNALGVLMTNEDFGIIFGVGTIVYGVAFLANGPLTDKVGGRRALLAAALGCALMNWAMGLYIDHVLVAGTVNNASLRFWFCVLYGANMYFQSFGAVAVVKVNAHWFHVRERGGFGGIFGTMIASGIFMAFTVNSWILRFAQARSGGGSEAFQTRWVFYVPAALLFLMFLIELAILKDRPSQAGYADFDTGDENTGGDQPLTRVMLRVITHPILLTVALIEFCTGVIRQGVMQWYQIYTKSVLALPASHYLRDGTWGRWSTVAPFFILSALLLAAGWRSAGRMRGWLYSIGGLLLLGPFLQAGWGGILFVAGVIGSNVAGHVSDLFFQSRRAPVAGVLYGLLMVCAIAMVFARGTTTTVVETSSDPMLHPGDRIVSVAGQSDFHDWPGAAEAFASVPATCLGGSRWDSSKHICSTKPDQTLDRLQPSGGTIPVTVERAGQLLSITLKDPAPAMRAGDRRVLKATPKPTRSPYLLGGVVFLISICVIGSHGVLSGTAAADFGGRRGTATAVGMIDGFVYLGTAVQSVSLGYLTERSWSYWPWFLLPFTVIGFLLCRRIWFARPRETLPILEGVLTRARTLGRGGVVVFDLDSTVFDNRPRQARILREFGSSRKLEALAQCTASDFDSGWDLRLAMRKCGLTEREADQIYPEAKEFWLKRFFTSPYCVDDVAIPGAPQFVKAVADAGAIVCYVTGRDEGMKDGTLDAMRRCGFPLPGDHVHLIMKPRPEMNDDQFKREAHRRISALGTVIAAFDNEPTHVNDYRRTFPDATVVHLATDHSGRPVALLKGVLSVPHFATLPAPGRRE